jgi:hypothetical protein
MEKYINLTTNTGSTASTLTIDEIGDYKNFKFESSNLTPRPKHAPEEKPKVLIMTLSGEDGSLEINGVKLEGIALTLFLEYINQIV